MKKLSVIMPCYNATRFLRPCIESMRPQLNDDIEIICVNDGSKDGTLQMLNELHEEIPQLVVVDQPNGGCGPARNAGFAKATGEYVWHLDADDLIAPDAFETIISTFEQNDIDSVIFGLRLIDEGGGEVTPYHKEYATEEVVSGTEAYLCETIPSFPWNRAFRRDFLVQNNLLFKAVYPHDEEFDFRTYVYSKRTKFLNKCLYDYRIVKMSDSRNPNSFLKFLDGYMMILDNHLGLLKEHGNREFCAKLTFNSVKNMYLKLTGYELAGGKDYDKQAFFARLKEQIGKFLKECKCGSKYYWMLRMAYLCPATGYRLLKTMYKIKKHA